MTGELNDMAIQFYDSDDITRFGRESPGKWEGRLIPEIHSLSISDPLIVELGCGRTSWTQFPDRYVAYDIGFNVLLNRLGNKIQGDMQRLPFRKQSVDFIFSIAALEHVPNPELVLEEIARVLKPEGKAYLAPAWFCRPWMAKGLLIKSYSELTWPDKLAKASLIIRDHIIWRALSIIPRRLWRELRWLLVKKPQPFDYKRLEPNLEEYIMSDSDAFTSMDPHAAILFFVSRGLQANYDGLVKRLLIKHVPIKIFRARK